MCGYKSGKECIRIKERKKANCVKNSISVDNKNIKSNCVD